MRKKRTRPGIGRGRTSRKVPARPRRRTPADTGLWVNVDSVGVGLSSRFYTSYYHPLPFNFQRNCGMIIIMNGFNVEVLFIIGWEERVSRTTNRYKK